ncbi:Cu,Zn superoxide dismutase-like protein, partial [Tothia fuscella]
LTTAQVFTGRLGDATQVLDNPMGAVYQAIIPKGKYRDIDGSIVAVSAAEKGTQFAVNFVGLPKEGGPFLYHIHVNAVPADGNCNGTLAHLDPYERGEVDACTPDRPETCQVGDLAGKYGTVNGTVFQRTFSDPYVSLHDDQGAFLGNRSFAIHFANRTRIACANFTS